MKNINLILVSIVFFAFKAYSQDYTMLNNYNSTLSKKNYTIGDTVTIGKASYVNGSTINYKQVLFSTNGKYFNNVSFDLTNKKGVIKKIYSNKLSSVSQFSNSVVLELNINSDTLIYVPIDNALKQKEIVQFPINLEPDNFKPFTPGTSTLLLLNFLDLKSEEAMIYYLSLHEPEIYKSISANEFEYEKNKKYLIQRIDSLRAITHKSDTFLLIVPLKLGKYNFETKTFPVVQGPMAFSSSYNAILDDETLEFDNFNDFSSINSTTENAEFFANNTAMAYDNTRTAYAILLVQFKDITTTERSGMNIDGNSKTTIIHNHLKICSLYAVDNSAFFYNFIGSK